MNGSKDVAALVGRILVAIRCHFVLGLLLGALALPPAFAATAAAEPRPAEATLTVVNRDIAVFRSELLGNPPAVRAERAGERIGRLDDVELSNAVKALPSVLGDLHGFAILVGDRQLFTLLEADLDPEDNLTLAQAAEHARAQLEDALRVKREQRSWPVLLNGLTYTAAATALLIAALWLLARIRRGVTGWLERRRAALAAGGGRVHWEEYLVGLSIRLLQLAWWALVLSLLYGWLAYVLAHFPLTQPLGNRLAHFVTSLLEWLGGGIIASLPGVATVVVVLFVTQAIAELVGQFFQRVQTGQTEVPFVHPETASATRRIATFIVWTLGFVVAYPFIPGSSSDAFKGLSVLLGVMISLGSSGLVTQMMSGLVVIYSRALHKGDFVAVQGIEGVVTELGSLATKIVTMRNEEVTIPNSVLVGNAIHNYSKLAGTQGSLVSTKATIGYDAPWRQVQALLVLAAERTPGLRQEPKPFVYQRALNDFYVEYELFAHIDRPLERVATLSTLHANIQDAFNEQGVQIMSPHFVVQPARAVVVPREQWYAAPASGQDSPRG